MYISPRVYITRVISPNVRLKIIKHVEDNTGTIFVNLGLINSYVRIPIAAHNP